MHVREPFWSAALWMMLLFCDIAHSESIPLIHDHGTLQVPAVINGKVSLDFTIDSGATDVSIPENVFSNLIRGGTVSATDFLDKRAYKLADGSTEFSQRFRIRSLRVGNMELLDVVASVVPSAGSLLLGQSFLSRLKSWSIDNERQVLAITESANPQSPLIVQKSKNILRGSGWVRLSAADDPAGQLFVDTASLQELGNRRSLREKHIFPDRTEKWQGKWVNYALDRWAFDCSERRVKLEARTDYYEDGTHWVADSALISSTSWHRVQPDTWKDGEMKLLCESR
jgi:clan AA aspartic protease (TIGR02281 family)